MTKFVAGLIASLLFVATPVLAESTSPPDLASMPIGQLEQGIEDSHPVAYFILAIRKFEAGAKDEAVRWLYVGQIRWRLHIAAHPDLPPDGDPALMASMMEVIGRPINEWAGGDVDGLIRSMQAALEWDHSHSNGFSDTVRYAAEYRSVRQGLTAHIKYMAGQRQYIAEERARNGLQNRIIIED